MSGITGIYRRDGQPVEIADIRRMGEVMSYRGPDGSGAWSDGPAGLGHLMLHSTPESLHEELPLVGRAGELVITADARIDNRDELIAALDLNGRARDGITDSELILLAYERWGEGCPEKLLGDFAFAIWDGRRGVMFCARDHFGMKPFYYHLSPRLFAFGSEIKALLTLAEVPSRVNETKIADYWAGILEDTQITFYEGILRLPPAHYAAISREGIAMRRYWALDPSRTLKLRSDEEYGRAYREIFEEAVRRRLRSAFPVGSTLSGGLDSSSIVCMSREILRPLRNGTLHTFSCIFDEPESDERPYINAVLAGGDLTPHNIETTELTPFTDLEQVLWHLDEPFFGTNLYLHWALMTSTREQGVRVLLDGIYGDGTVSWGFGYMSELARTGRWLALNREAKELARIAKIRRRDVLMRFAVKPTLEEMRSAWRGVTGHKGNGWTPHITIDPAFAKRVGLEERWLTLQAPLNRPPRSSREEHWISLTTGLMQTAVEMADKLAAARSVDWRAPFLDPRLAEFCLSLPGNQKLSHGFNRMVARRALVGILPEEVRLRRDKAGFTQVLIRTFKQTDQFKRTALSDVDCLADYCNMHELRKCYERFTEAPNLGDGGLLFKATTLATWLKNSQLARVSERKGGETYEEDLQRA